MSIRKKDIKSNKHPILDLKNKINKQKLDKRNLLRAHEDEDDFLLYHLFKYNGKKHSVNKKGYLAFQKLSCLNTKIRKLSHRLKGMYGITVGTDHPQYAESPDPIIVAIPLSQVQR